MTGPVTVSCTSTEATVSSTGTSHGQDVRTSSTRARWTPAGAPLGLAVNDNARDASVAKVPLVGSTASQAPGAGDKYSTSMRNGDCGMHDILVSSWYALRFLVQYALIQTGNIKAQAMYTQCPSCPIGYRHATKHG